MIGKIAIIGSTGVLGTKLLLYLKKNKKKISLISCYSNYKKLINQKKLTGSSHAIVLKNKLKNFDNNLIYGDKHLFTYIENKTIGLFYILNTGFESLKYIDHIIKYQKNCTIAVANKEILVAGGKILIDKILSSGNYFLPLDSEHFSLIDLFPNRNLVKNYVSKIYLTASGGPFYFDSNFQINTVDLKKATKHPIWKMGFKNSIDSSNLVNKILECFELSALYNFPLSKIGIAISPKAFAHSVVFFNDKRISINCFVNDMMIPLTSPFSRNIFNTKPNTNINLLTVNDLSFSPFNNKKFQIFKYYKKLLSFSHVQQINFMILNAEAVNRFISNYISYRDIIPFIFKNINKYPKKKNFKNLYDIIEYTNKVSFKVRQL
jgi:1-deoxy-D-xylulose-5-phosphate reductoisomerase